MFFDVETTGKIIKIFLSQVYGMQMSEVSNWVSKFGAAKLGVCLKRTGSLVQANWEFGAAKLGWKIF